MELTVFKNKFAPGSEGRELQKYIHEAEDAIQCLDKLLLCFEIGGARPTIVYDVDAVLQVDGRFFYPIRSDKECGLLDLNTVLKSEILKTQLLFLRSLVSYKGKYNKLISNK